MAPLIIGIGNRARAGKDQFAEYLRLAIREQVVCCVSVNHFADPLKEAMRKTFGLQWCNLYGTEEQRQSDVPKWVGKVLQVKTHREAMQVYGCTMRDNFPGIWREATLRDPGLAGMDVVILADMRFPDEFKAIKERGGYNIQISRPDATVNGHSSEKHLDNADYDLHITNDGTLEHLKHTAEMVASWIVKDHLLPIRNTMGVAL